MALASGAHMSAPWKHLLDMLRNHSQGAREKVKKTREWRNLMFTVSQGCCSGCQTVNKTNTVFHRVLFARLFSRISVWHCCRGVAEEQEEGEQGGETWGAQCLFFSAWNASASRCHRRLCWRADKSYGHSEVRRWAGRDLNETPFETKTCLRFNTVQLRLPWQDMAQQKAPRLPPPLTPTVESTSAFGPAIPLYFLAPWNAAPARVGLSLPKSRCHLLTKSGKNRDLMLLRRWQRRYQHSSRWPVGKGMESPRQALSVRPKKMVANLRLWRMW